jgi:hypothetical protein
MLPAYFPAGRARRIQAAIILEAVKFLKQKA